MKKFFATFICVVAFATNMSAQFSEGTKFLGASLTGADLSYSKNQNLGLGAEAKAGYFIMDDLMLQAEAGFDVRFKECQKIFVGGKGRYYVADKVYVGAGVKLLHDFDNNSIFYHYLPQVHCKRFMNLWFSLSFLALYHECEI